MAYHGRYETPAALLRDPSLSREEKIEMLGSWRDDKEAYMRASHEGMAGVDRSEWLQQIENALIDLREESA